jgi:predicted NUDIX family phosphoesterase
MYHIGLVFRVSCLSPQITVREKNKIRGRLVPVFQLQDYQDKLENWSNILLPYIPELMVVGR